MDTPYETTLSPTEQAGYWIAFEDEDGNWVAAPAENATRMGARLGQAVTVLAEPDPWPTEGRILIRRGYDASRGEARNIVAYYDNDSGAYFGLFDGERYSFYPDITGDRIDEYTPISIVPTDALVELLDSHDDLRSRIYKFRLALLNTPGLNITNTEKGN